ncbi:Conserved oligomeric Golgi complex subunit 7 [Lamellibrachia satsuma]|nr:Conserved oligomeric Golgi complex subunit 7 [Lamellibrachia satsuma]
MDYSKFLDDDFDVKEWVNGAFNAQKEGNKDQYATTLVMKLQMFIQEVNHVIDECCQQTVTNLPRVMRELDAVKQEASLLREQMQIVKNDIEKVEQDTSQSMQTLLKLDLIKSRMNDASAALQEADNWTTLSADVDVVFESQDVHAIAEKLVGLQHSLEMLTDVPDYADRCQFLETLKNRLEAVLSPQVVAAFSAQSVESAQMYAQIFSDIGRLPQLTKYYHKCHKGHLLQSWRSVVQTGGAHDNDLPEQLSVFYDQLMSMWHSQIKWCTQVFTDPAPIVVDLLTEVLNDLDPSPSSLISRHIDGDNQPVAALIQLKQLSERFAKSFEDALEMHSSSHLQLPSVQSLAVTIYAPYKPYIQKLGSFEESTLTSALNSIPLDHEEVFECTGLLAESVSKLFSAAKQIVYSSIWLQIVYSCIWL